MDKILEDPVSYFRMRAKGNERQRRYIARHRTTAQQRTSILHSTTFFVEKWMKEKEFEEKGGRGEKGNTGNLVRVSREGRSASKMCSPLSLSPGFPPDPAAKPRSRKSRRQTMADSSNPPSTPPTEPVPLPTVKKSGRKKKSPPQPVIKILGPRTIFFN
jgi:hypothetical protein